MSLYKNLLTSQLMPYGGIISLMQWDDTLFDGMVLPDGVDKDLVIDTIMQKYGDSPLDHEDPAYLKYYIPVWSKRNLDSWTKLFATLSFDYNPLENALLDETTEETRNIDRKQRPGGPNLTAAAFCPVIKQISRWCKHRRNFHVFALCQHIVYRSAEVPLPAYNNP